MEGSKSLELQLAPFACRSYILTAAFYCAPCMADPITLHRVRKYEICVSHLRASDTRTAQLAAALWLVGDDMCLALTGIKTRWDSGVSLLITPHHKLGKRTRQSLITVWLLRECLEFSLSPLHIPHPPYPFSPSHPLSLSFHISIFLSRSLTLWDRFISLL